MKFCLLLTTLCVFLTQGLARDMIIIVSEPGEGEYEVEFTRQAVAWQQLAEKANIQQQTIGLSPQGDISDLEKLNTSLSNLPLEGDDLWLVLIGHGSFDGKNSFFNLRGKDLSAEAFSRALTPYTRRLIILNLFSASFPFTSELAGKNRVLIGSTRSPNQRNYTRFGEKMADTLHSLEADLDIDGNLSLLEATLYASAETRTYYADMKRVVQEHAVIDDNGDGIATELTRFHGLEAEKATEEATSSDGIVARDIYFGPSKADPLSPEERQTRSKLEAEINSLKKRKTEIPEEEYYRKLESILRKIADLYQAHW